MLVDSMRKIRAIADYQFGRGIGKKLFPSNVEITFSKRTGKIRHVYLDRNMIATLRPTNGFFSLTIEGGRRLLQIKPMRLWVQVEDEAASFIAEGRSVFAKHVADCDEEIRPGEEVVVINCKTEVLAVGRSVLAGKEIKAFEQGVAVRIRHGVDEESRGKVKKGKVKRENRKL